MEMKYRMSRQRELAKNTAILAFGRICTQCISFLLLPLYTAKLDTVDYGTFDLILTYVTLFLPLVNWQFDQGIFRFLLDCRNNKEKQTSLFSTVFSTNTVQSLVFSAIVVLVMCFWKISYGWFIIAYLTIQVYTALLLQFARGLGKNTIYAMASFISASLTVVFNAIALVWLNLKLNGLFISTVAAQSIAIIYMCIALKPWRYFSIKSITKDVFKSIKSYSLPLIPNNLAWWVVNVSDRTIVSYFLGIAVNGIYTVAHKFSNVFIQFYNIFNLSWTETVSLHFQDKDRDEFFSKTITTIFKLFASACFGIVAVMPFVYPIMINEKYADGYAQVLILMYAMLCRVIVGLYSCVYIATKQSKKIAYTSVAAAIINIVVNIALVNFIGLYAASLSSLVAFGSMAIMRYIDVNKIVKMRIDGKVLFSSLIIAVLLTFTYYIRNTLLNVIMLAIVVLYAVIFDWAFVKSAFSMIKVYINKFKTKMTD